MMSRIAHWGLIFSLAGWVTQASAQVTAEGRAFGTLVSVLQLPLLTIITGDTEPQSVTAPGAFDKDGSARTLDASPLAIVINDVTHTERQANLSTNECTSFVNSAAGSSTAVVLPGMGPAGQGVIEVAASGSNASVTGSGEPIGDGQVAEVVINGNRIELPSPQPPNTTLISGLNLLTFNRQVLTSDAVSGTRSLIVQALRAQLISNGEVLDVVLSESDASLTALPEKCFTSPCTPNFTGSKKNGTLVTDNGTKNVADPGDVIAFTVSAKNSGTCPATGFQIIDRIPLYMTVDATSIKLGNTVVPPTAVIDCPSSAHFENNCPGEQDVDPSRKCIVVDGGTLQPNATENLTYNATVNQDLPTGAPVCNVALIGPQPVVLIGFGGEGVLGGGDVLQTTGSGGCSLNPSAPSSDGWPILLIGALLGWRRLRRRSR